MGRPSGLVHIKGELRLPFQPLLPGILRIAQGILYIAVELSISSERNGSPVAFHHGVALSGLRQYPDGIPTSGRLLRPLMHVHRTRIAFSCRLRFRYFIFCQRDRLFLSLLTAYPHLPATQPYSCNHHNESSRQPPLHSYRLPPAPRLFLQALRQRFYIPHHIPLHPGKPLQRLVQESVFQRLLLQAVGHLAPPVPTQIVHYAVPYFHITRFLFSRDTVSDSFFRSVSDSLSASTEIP